jgi:hypothetical protein
MLRACGIEPHWQASSSPIGQTKTNLADLALPGSEAAEGHDRIEARGPPGRHHAKEQPD